jgi:putative nucleotidyltransferase with HDIG domain
VADRSSQRLVVQRVAAAALALLVVPVIVALGSVADEEPIRVGDPSPRTVLAPRQIVVDDVEATETARRTAEASVNPVVVDDREAQAAIVGSVRDVFSSARAAREPVAEDDDDAAPPSQRPSSSQELQRLVSLAPELDPDVADALVGLSNADLEVVERETIAMAQGLARQRVTEDGVQQLLDDTIPFELALRSLPGTSGEDIVAPLLETTMRPTLRVDPDETAAARARAADSVEDITRVWLEGQAIVRTGDVVDPLAASAVEQLGLAGTSPLLAWLRATLAMVLVIGIVGAYLARMQPIVWVTGKKLVLLSVLVTAYAALVVGSYVLVEATSPGWFYAVPAGALAMLVALLIHPVIGLATMLPAAVLVLLVSPSSAAVALFSAATVLVSVPLTTRIGKRSDLRSATLRAALSYPLVAAVLVGVFGPRDALLVAIAAGALNGLVTAVIVQGAMPFLESLFRLPTVTALLDLADRNHPLLRELEQRALGTYNHSVMVAALTERACRAVGADPLLGSVAALYHDIGKVRQPHFFIENQQGIANPHDDLEPEVSAVIIQNHVVDGVEMAIEHRLPPEVVACIRSHHGTMLVSYFYDQAVRAADGDHDAVDEQHFRYKGGKPRSREAAILLLADCCEATTRAMAMSRGTLPRDEIESTVERLLRERLDDGQFADSELTFRDLEVARATIVESLVGIYHPRIAYPGRTPASGGDDPGATPLPALTAAGALGDDPAPATPSAAAGVLEIDPSVETHPIPAEVADGDGRATAPGDAHVDVPSVERRDDGAVVPAQPEHR